jgi:Membrane bound FAD containing D-sorbitol dehydrogenase
MNPLTRRTTLRLSLSGLGLSAAITGLLPSWRVRAQTRISDELHARFLRWSRTATGFIDLPASTARVCIELVLRAGITPENLSDLDPGAYRGTPTEKRLLEAWYAGVFENGRTEVRSYETTLMWRAAGLDPPPSTCSSGPERWASAPSSL